MRQNYVKLIALAAAVMAFSLCNAQNMTDPPSGSVFLSGDIPHFAWEDDGKATKDLFHQLYWFESKDVAPNEDNFYHKFPVSPSKCGGGSKPDPRDRSGVVTPCYTEFDANNPGTNVDRNFAAVLYERKDDWCYSVNTKTFGPQTDFFVLTPFFLAPLPTGDYYACPDGSVEVSVLIQDAINPKDPNAPIAPTSVIWQRFDIETQQYVPVFTDEDIADGISTLSYNLGASFAETEQFQVHAAWNNNGCNVAGTPLPITITSALSRPLNPPITQVYASCEMEQTTITVPNPYGYSGVYWYATEQAALAETPLLHDGFTYTTTNFDGLQRVYVQYYKVLESGCTVRSAPVPIFLFGAPLTLFNLPISNSVTLEDHRNYNDLNCDSQDPTRPTYHDLAEPGQFVNQIKEGFQASATNDCFDFEIRATALEWTVERATEPGLDPWILTNNGSGQTVKRVCADNIRSANGPYGSKTYQLVADIQGAIVGKGCGILDEEIPFNCSVPVRGAQTWVYVNEPGTITDNDCRAPTQSVINTMVNSYPTCNELEVEEVCADNRPVTLGPSRAALEDYFFGVLPVPEEFDSLFTYEWLNGQNPGEGWTTNGLSATDIANPTVRYNDMTNTSDGQIAHYVCRVRFVGAGAVLDEEYYHCAYVYKCSNCQTPQIIENPFE